MANRKQEIDEMQVDQEMRQRLLSQVKNSVSTSTYNSIFRKERKLRTTAFTFTTLVVKILS